MQATSQATSTGSEIIPIGDLLQITQNTAMSVSGLLQQVGIVTAKLSEHEMKMNDLDAHYDQRFKIIERRVSVREQKEILDNSQRRHIRQAVRNRVYALLGVEFEDGKMTAESRRDSEPYRHGFFRKCYTDAKNHSRMAEEFADTLSIDYDEVMGYIKAWVPEQYGVEGYKEHLDGLREAREARR